MSPQKLSNSPPNAPPPAPPVRKSSTPVRNEFLIAFRLTDGSPDADDAEREPHQWWRHGQTGPHHYAAEQSRWAAEGDSVRYEGFDEPATDV